MDSQDIISALSETRKPRATLYLNADTINAYFSQVVSAVQEVVRDNKLSPEVSAGLLGLGFKLAGEKGEASTYPLDPLLKAILIEYQAKMARTLVSLESEEPRPGTTMRYAGPSWIADIDEEVAPPRLPEPIARKLQEQRARQEKRLQARDAARRTIVWYRDSAPFVASIASDEWVNEGLLTSYIDSPPFGILGRYERDCGDLVLIAPFWIWCEGW